MRPVSSCPFVGAGRLRNRLPGRIPGLGATLSTSTIVAYAAKPGQRVGDQSSDTPYSPYTDALIRYLEAPFDVGVMLRWVRDSVLISTAGRQEPVVHNSLSGRRIHLATWPAAQQPREAGIATRTQDAPPTRVALAIGDAEYEDLPSLVSPIHDASAVSASLERLGFEVIRLENAGKAKLEAGLEQLTELASHSEIAAIYYSGVGFSQEEREYLLPVDSSIEIQNMASQGVPLDALTRAVESASILRLIILDAPFHGIARPSSDR